MLIVFFLFGGLFRCLLISFWLYVFFLFIFSILIGLIYLNYELVGLHFFYNSLVGDRISIGLILLTFWILVLIIYSSIREFYSSKGVYYLFFILIIALSLVLIFLRLDFLIFYIIFEVVLLPIFFIVLGWGYQPERLQAGVYLVFYTLFGSLPLLIIILYILNFIGSFYMLKQNSIEILGIFSYFFYLIGIFAFLVKIPMFFIHLWLPKAHVEAPIAGSMILAGVLLKIGGYGILRLSIIYYGAISFFSVVLVRIRLFGGIILSLLCLRQRDIKALIAYSSVVHIGIVIAGRITLFSVGVVGAYVLIVGHGLCSSGIFCLANLRYERRGSRSLLMNKGLINILPVSSLIWFFLCSSNMSAPPSLNLLGELLLIISIVL
jgi:NADH-ubiquinone oxidoreductase chain 4